jgi:hypothetical protein
MTWIPSENGGAVNEDYVVQVIRSDTGSILIMRDGTKITSPMQFDVAAGQLVAFDPNDEDSIPF